MCQILKSNQWSSAPPTVERCPSGQPKEHSPEVCAFKFQWNEQGSASLTHRYWEEVLAKAHPP